MIAKNSSSIARKSRYTVVIATRFSSAHHFRSLRDAYQCAYHYHGMIIAANIPYSIAIYGKNKGKRPFRCILWLSDWS